MCILRKQCDYSASTDPQQGINRTLLNVWFDRPTDRLSRARAGLGWVDLLLSVYGSKAFLASRRIWNFFPPTMASDKVGRQQSLQSHANVGNRPSFCKQASSCPPWQSQLSITLICLLYSDTDLSPVSWHKRHLSLLSHVETSLKCHARPMLGAASFFQQRGTRR